MHLTTLHAHLLSEIDGRTFRPLLQEITLNHPAFAAYPSWGAVAAALSGRHLPSEAADALLAPMLAAFATGSDPRWGTILCACCYRNLVAAYLPRKTWTPQGDEVFQELIATFLEVCRRTAARSHVSGILRRLANETTHRLHEEFAYRWKRETHELSTDPSELVPHLDRQQEPELREDLLDLAEHRERTIAELQRHRDAGHITETDFQLLVGTKLYGRSMAEEGALHGLTRETTKKKCQRAEAAIRRAARGGVQ